MHPTRTLVVAAVVAAALLVGAAPAMASGGGQGKGGGAVYTLTNSAGGNAVAVFERARDGSLTPAGSVSTGGDGAGAGLGSQGALVLDRGRLLAVNAGSDTISLLRVRGHRSVRLVDTAASGGVRPISVTVHGKLVYVLNAGGAATPANVHGFVARRGELVPLPGSARPLSTAAPDPAQIEFSPNGRHLVVTEKATNTIVTYRVTLGYAGAPTAQPSAGETPFGFAFDRRGRLVVSEAFGGAPDASVLSSYALARDGTVTPITPNVATTETAACWVVVTKNSRYAYTTNTGSNSISGYRIGKDGGLTLLDADGKTATTGAGPLDLALSKGSRFLYSLNSGVSEVQGFAVGGDGSLEPLGSAGGLPAGTVGLAAS
ncbi:MAG TPA: beta-propeller fold lactonase family protein [Gaiellaceae bacterium]|nr:beta-propeller fold lactonase family protein [Gaiellaceae bacterium]